MCDVPKQSWGGNIGCFGAWWLYYHDPNRWGKLMPGSESRFLDLDSRAFTRIGEGLYTAHSCGGYITVGKVYDEED